MGDVVVKDNALMTASYNLSLVEQRLILLAIVEARRTKKGINANNPLIIASDSYIGQFRVHRTTAYQALKDACHILFSRYFSFQELHNGKVKNVKSRWVSRIAYIDDLAQVELIFAPDVVPLISELENRFSQYAIEQVSQLSSAYAIRLYEILISWRTTGTVDYIELPELKRKLGVKEGDYRLIADFKKRVLDVAIHQINQHTDIQASYQQHKQGRTITGFSFQFTFKKPPKARQRRAKAQATQTTDPDPQDALSRYNGLKSLAELSGEPLQSLASEQEWGVFQGMGLVG